MIFSNRELLRRLGCPLLLVDDLFSLDEGELAKLHPIHALIFLFKWVDTSASGSDRSMAGRYDRDFPGFFAHQTVQNACAVSTYVRHLTLNRSDKYRH